MNQQSSSPPCNVGEYGPDEVGHTPLQETTKTQAERTGVDLVFGRLRKSDANSDVWWQSNAIKVDAPPYNLPDGEINSHQFERELRHEHALWGGTNHVYVELHNNGGATAHNVRVKLFYVQAAVGLPPLPRDIWEQFPNDPAFTSPWHVVHTPWLTHHTLPTLDPGETVVLKWDWPIQPAQATHYSLLAIMTCDEQPISATTGIILNELRSTSLPLALKSNHLVEPPNVDYFPWRQLLFLDIYNAHSSFEFYDLIIRLQDFAEQGKLFLLLPPLYTQQSLEESLKGLYYEEGFGFEELIELHGDHWDLPDEIDPYHLYQVVGVPQTVIPQIGLEPGARLRIALVLEAPANALPDSYHRFEVMQQLDGEIVGGVSYALHAGKQDLEQPATHIRVVLEKVRIWDKHEGFLRGRGEFSFVANVSINGNPGSSHSTRLPFHSVYKLSDRPGQNEQMINTCIFEGRLSESDSLEVSISGKEHDWPDASDPLTFYRRRFSGPPSGWLGSYWPGDEMHDPEEMPDWEVWYRIEAIIADQ